MKVRPFYDEITLAETAEELAKEALKQGLIPSYVARHFPDNIQFYIPDEREGKPLTSEQAYLHLKRLVGGKA
jgi:hypothetical protein